MRHDVRVIARFGDCEIDLDRLEVRSAGEIVAVEPQVFDVLSYLLEHRDRLVSKEELLDNGWGDRFVTESRGQIVDDHGDLFVGHTTDVLAADGDASSGLVAAAGQRVDVPAQQQQEEEGDEGHDRPCPGGHLPELGAKS